MKAILLVALPLVGALAACGSSDAGPAAAQAASTPPPSAASLAPLPKAVGKPILIVQPAGGPSAASRLDLAGLVAMSSRDVDIYEPFVKKTMRFQGVPLQELLARAGITSGSVTIHALDDYTFTGQVSDLAGAILATRSGGLAMAVADGGPIRVVFESGSELSKNTDAWVWSVDSISQVRAG